MPGTLIRAIAIIAPGMFLSQPPTIAFWKSPSPKPTARSIARFGERAAPWVMVLLLQLSATGKTPDAENQLRFDYILLESVPRPSMLVHPNFDPVAISLGPIAI